MAISTTAFPFTSEVTYDELGWPTLDRAVDSTVLRNMIKKFFSDGLFLSADANCWKVTAPDDSSQTVDIAPGSGVIRGATGYTDSAGVLALPDADSAKPRYDMVVARLNDNSAYRNIYLDIIQGTAATTPTYPALTQTDSIWEIGIAALYRPANSTTITQSQITDLRADSDYAGQVNVIDSIDTSGWFDQLNAYFAEFQQTCEDDYATYTARCLAIIADLSTYEGSMETEFMTWFNEMKGQLSEDAAGHLQLEIDNLKDQIGIPDDYDPDSTYLIDEYCIENDKLYRCIANTSVGSFDPDCWEETTVQAEIDRKIAVEKDKILGEVAKGSLQIDSNIILDGGARLIVNTNDRLIARQHVVFNFA